MTLKSLHSLEVFLQSNDRKELMKYVRILDPRIQDCSNDGILNLRAVGHFLPFLPPDAPLMLELNWSHKI